jgi:HEAT repeat protein
MAAFQMASRAAVVTLLLITLFSAGCGGGATSDEVAPNVASIPSLMHSLKLRDPAARSRAAIALGKMGPAAREAVPALSATLKDRDVSVRAASAYALGRIGPDAKSALADLKKLTQQRALHEVATEAVKQIGE